MCSNTECDWCFILNHFVSCRFSPEKGNVSISYQTAQIYDSNAFFFSGPIHGPNLLDCSTRSKKLT